MNSDRGNIMGRLTMTELAPRAPVVPAGLALAVAVLLFLAGCGGGGGGNVRPDGPPTPPPEECPAGQVGTPPNCITQETVLEKYRTYLREGDSNDAWPMVGDYTHHFHFLFGDAVGDELFAIAPTNVSCQEESCWTSEASANSLGTVTGIQRVIEHADIPVYRLRGENDLVGIAYDSWGAWLEFTAFSVSRTCDIGGECQGGDTSVRGSVVGSPSLSIPIGTAGSASWVGVVTAVDTETHNLILGDASVTIDDLDAAAPHVDVALTGLWDVDAGAARADIQWNDIAVSDGSSSVSVPGVDTLPSGSFGGGHAQFGFGLGGTAGEDYMIGQFFGENHQEVAGSFVHSATQTAGAFGGKRR